MELTQEIGKLELLAISIFIVANLIFAYKNYRISSKLGSSFPIITIFKFILRTAVMALLIIGLLGPSFGTSKSKVLTIAKDIFITVDLSKSMNARDIQPSRLEKVKFELKKIIDAFPSDRIGLIIFSNEAFVQCPLTYDKSALSMFIETLSTSLVPNAGTDFYEPLKLANEKLTVEDGDSKKSSKLILLISDGEDFSEGTSDILEELEENDIKLFTLGVGTAQGAMIPSKRGFKKDNEGNEVVSKLNSDDLKKLAYETDGKYYEINTELSQVEKLINDINKIKGEIKESKIVDVTNNKYFYFIFVALGLIVIDLLIQTKTFKI